MCLEQWRPVVGYEGFYEVSDRGNIRRIAPGPGARVNHVLLTYRTSNGYEMVVLCRDGIPQHVLVHRAVLEAFRGTDPDRPECNHKDGNKQNNHLDNLEWTSSSENKQHAIASGLAAIGEKHYASKLTAADIPVIRALHGVERQRVTAARYGVSTSLIGMVQNRRVWKHI